MRWARRPSRTGLVRAGAPPGLQADCFAAAGRQLQSQLVTAFDLAGLDDDVMRAAEKLAVERQTTIGRVISDLARQTLTQPAQGPLIERNGFYVLPSRGGVVTTALVNRLLEQADLEDAGLLPKD